MEKIKIGIICPSEIAFRRFMPAVQLCDNIEYVGVASANALEWFGTEQEIDESVIEKEHDKAVEFQKLYGGKVFSSYAELLSSDEINAVYLPLPPALHYKWGKVALENGKHLFLEKPSTTTADDTRELVRTAEEKGLALHENYMFVYHEQLSQIDEIVRSGEIGDIRLYRIAFGFPRRAQNDFRYNKALGGGALLDCGGYTLKLAQMLLGKSAKVVHANLNYIDEFDVDIYGSTTMINDKGVTAQISFGMDNSYRCELEIWGSQGSINTGRIFTAPAGFIPTADIKVGNDTQTVELAVDDTFAKSIGHFVKCVQDDKVRLENYELIIKQAELVDEVKNGRND